MNFASVYERQKRPTQMFHPLHTSVANYWTEAIQKNEMKQEYGDFFNNLHLIPDPLKKNLADTLITNETPEKPKKQEKKEMPLPKQENTALGGIGSFFSGVLNVLSGVMFRSRSPGYYECFEDGQQGAPQAWHSANTNVQDKNGNGKSYDAPTNVNVSTDMNTDRTVTSCETKLNQVLNLLGPKQTTSSNPVWVRKRPKKVFVEPSSVNESFEDAFSPEDFINLPEDPFYPCSSPMQYQNPELYETAAQKTKLNAPIKENMEFVMEVKKNDLELKKDQSETQLEKNNETYLNLENKLESNMEQMQLDKHMEQKSEHNSDRKTEITPESDMTIKNQLVSSCEDKLSKLKALLLEKRKKNQSETVPDTEPKEMEKKPADKHYKNPNRRTNKRRKAKMRCKIEDDLLFANEISVGTPPSVENSPRDHSVNFGDYFDELKGRFRSASIGSEDSFQIVFNDSPKQGRIRTTSDCDSEDSFIVFEDSPESCYLSNDVFGSDSDLSDSGCVETCKLSHSLTRTVSNLADDSLYVESEDEIDFAETVSDNTGLLLDDKKKQLRKDLPSKKVRFSPAPPKVHVMRVWAFAARQARAGHWERYAVDRERFKRRIADVDVAISWALRPQHRRRVMFQRFMPWWNQQKRRELAEKEAVKVEQARKQLELLDAKENKDLNKEQSNSDNEQLNVTDVKENEDLNIEQSNSEDNQQLQVTEDVKGKDLNSEQSGTDKEQNKQEGMELLDVIEDVDNEDKKLNTEHIDIDSEEQDIEGKKELKTRKEVAKSKQITDVRDKEDKLNTEQNDTEYKEQVGNELNTQKEDTNTKLTEELKNQKEDLGKVVPENDLKDTEMNADLKIDALNTGTVQNESQKEHDS